MGFLLSPLGRSMAIAVAAAVLLTGTHWKAYQAGAASERAASLSRSIDLIRERSKTNAEINSLDTAALCRELGGRWVQPDNVCE